MRPGRRCRGRSPARSGLPRASTFVLCAAEPMTPTDDLILSAKLKSIRRRRTIWWACWVPGAYSLTLLFHWLTGELPPYFAGVLLMFVWVACGYIGSLIAYRNLMEPSLERPTFMDAVALRIPAKGSLRSAQSKSRGPLSGPGGEAD